MTIEIAQMEQLTCQAVTDVFRNMLSMEIRPEPPLAPVEENDCEQIIGSVGFAGDATGIICLYTDVELATALTSRMLGIAEAEVDTNEMVNDAIGELSNMVAGFVKSHLCDGGLPCTLTIPSIVRGRKLSVEGAGDVMRRVVGFQNCQYHFSVEILLKQPSQ
jgi:chemotaxis protein CheX